MTNNYAAGNILNLLLKLKLKDDFSYFDLSGISIWNADLQDANLTGVDFSNSDLKKSSLYEPLGCIHSIAFNKNGSLFATGDAHGLIRVHDTNSFELCEILNNDKGNQIWSVTFSAITYKTQDNQCSYLLASGGEDGRVKFFQIFIDSSSNKIKIINKTTNIHTNPNDRRILSVAFSPNGKIFANGGDGDNSIKLLKIKENNGTFTFKPIPNGELAVKDVSCMTFIDDNCIASGNQNGDINLSFIGRTKKLLNFKAHTGVVRCIAYNKKRKILASGGEDGNVKFFSITSQNIALMSIELPRVSQVRTLAFSEDGNYLAAGIIDNNNKQGKSEHKIKLWKYDETKQQWKFKHHLDQEGHDHLIRSIAFCPDSNQPQLLISGGDGRTVKFWDIEIPKSQQTLRGYANRIWSVAISRDGKTFACGGEDNKIRLWKYDDRTHIPIQILSKHEDWVWSVAFKPESDILASAGEDKMIVLWRLKKDKGTWEEISELKGHDKRVRCVAFHPTENILASAGNDNKVILWNIENLINSSTENISPSADNDNKDINHSVIEKFKQHKGRVLSLAFSPSGDYLASSSRDKTICLYYCDRNDRKKWVSDKRSDNQNDYKHQDQVHSIAFSSKSEHLVSGGFDKKLILWEINIDENNAKPSLKYIKDWEEEQKILVVAFHPERKIIASAGDRHFITLWDIEKIDDIRVIKKLKGHKRAVESIVFSPDGKRLISCSQDQTIKFWDIDGNINISVHTIELGKPYQDMNISGVKNLAESQISALLELGAFRQEFKNY
ncbi:MAG TPA: pentapeptide repeat-containing protein [Nostocaceae cyanobacterium]|nr:pentapeptide repeat-containing protein [Nostocaceae cyanobacterium]